MLLVANRAVVRDGQANVQSFFDVGTSDPRIAPMRTPAQLRVVEVQEAIREHFNGREATPWDPWPASRIGYDAPTAEREADPRLPERPALEALRSYLHRMLGERCT